MSMYKIIDDSYAQPLGNVSIRLASCILNIARPQTKNHSLALFGKVQGVSAM